MKNPLSNFYDVKLDAGNLTLARKSKNVLLKSLISLAGLLILIFGIYIHYQLILFGVIITLLPWISRQWQYPNKITFSKEGELVLETGHLIPNIRKIPQSQIQELRIEKIVKGSDVSAFQEGNQEVVYNFILDTIDRNQKLLRLRYRQEQDEQIEEIRGFIRQSLKILKSDHPAI